MEFSKEKKKNLALWIISVFTICSLIFLAVQNIGTVASAIGWCFKLFTPLIMGAGFALVLDVTNTGYENGAQFALENDLGIDLFTAHRIVEAVEMLGAKYEFKHCAEPDESWDYNDYGIPVLSVCAVVDGFLHGNEGVCLPKKSLIPYCNSLLAVLDVLA